MAGLFSPEITRRCHVVKNHWGAAWHAMDDDRFSLPESLDFYASAHSAAIHARLLGWNVVTIERYPQPGRWAADGTFEVTEVH